MLQNKIPVILNNDLEVFVLRDAAIDFWCIGDWLGIGARGTARQRLRLTLHVGFDAYV